MGRPFPKFKEVKKNYFNVTNPEGLTRTVFAETEFEAIAICTEKDNGRFIFKQYKKKKV